MKTCEGQMRGEDENRADKEEEEGRDEEKAEG